MIFALFANTTKTDALETTREIIDFLQNNKAQVVMRDELAEKFSVLALSQINSSQIDFAISLGGDGTILRLIHNNPELKAPIMGINLGHLGFMADVPLAEAFSALKDLLLGKFRLEKRLMLEVISKNNKSFSVNEIVIHRGQNLNLIDVAIHVDGFYLNTFSADGIIISTPCGSTAYSLAAGGPILTPELEALVITPLCAHTISNRPIVLMPQEKIEVCYQSKNKAADLIVDGFLHDHLAYNETFTIQKSPRIFQMVHLKNADYFSTLRTKLGWSGQVPLNQQQYISS